MPRLHGCRGAAMYMDVLYVVCASLQGCNLLEQCRSNCRGAHKRRYTGCSVCMLQKVALSADKSRIAMAIFKES